VKRVWVRALHDDGASILRVSLESLRCRMVDGLDFHKNVQER
jgi:hypothetical protein